MLHEAYILKKERLGYKPYPSFQQKTKIIKSTDVKMLYFSFLFMELVSRTVAYSVSSGNNLVFLFGKNYSLHFNIGFGMLLLTIFREDLITDTSGLLHEYLT